MDLKNIVVTGGTGFVGRRLLPHLDQPLVLTRSPEKHMADPNAKYAYWNSDTILDPETLVGCQGVVHLAGEPIAEGRWTTERKQRIRDSRVIGTRCLVKSLAKMDKRPEVLVAASAVGYYGNRPGEDLTEDSEPGEGFLSDVCEEWEAEAAEAEHLGIRVCRVRLGIVLEPSAGALEKMLPFFKMGVAGPLGSGRQYFPWVHVDDIVGILLHCLQNRHIQGAVNAVAPESLSNLKFTRKLGKALRRPTLLPVPKFGLKLLYGEFADSLFDDQKVVPQALQQSGYRFKFPNLDTALKDLL